MADPSIRDRIITGDVNALKAQTDRRYDVVTAFDIIEHTHDPGAFLKEIGDLIPTGGMLVITTPDTEHYLRYLMGSRWPMLQAIQHTVLFSRKSLIELSKRAGFSLLKTCDAKKALTPKYLFEQLADLNPLLFACYKAASKVLPSKLLNMGIFVNIGEFMLVLRKD